REDVFTAAGCRWRCPAAGGGRGQQQSRRWQRGGRRVRGSKGQEVRLTAVRYEHEGGDGQPAHPFVSFGKQGGDFAAKESINGETRLLRSAWRQSRCFRRRHQEGLSQAGDETPSGPQSGQSEIRGAVQGGQGSLRGSLRFRQTRRL